MKKIPLGRVRKDHVAAAKAGRKGVSASVTRGVNLPANSLGLHVNPRFDPDYLKRCPLPIPRPLKRGELGVVALLKRDRDER